MMMKSSRTIGRVLLSVFAGSLVIKPLSVDIKTDGYFTTVSSHWHCLTVPVMKCVNVNPIQRVCAPSFADVHPKMVLMGPNYDAADVWSFLENSAERQCATIDGGI